MRIIFEKNIGNMRVTGFEYEAKYSLKYELNFMEQWFKFRDGAIENIETLKDLVSENLSEGVRTRFQEMEAHRSDALSSITQEDLDSLKII